MRSRIIPIVTAIALFAACGKKDKRPEGELTAETPPVLDLPFHPDPGPAIQRITGPRAPNVRPTAQASVDRIERGDGYVLAVVPLSPEVLGNVVGTTNFVVEAPMHGSAFMWSGAAVGDANRNVSGVIVRMQGNALPPKFTIRWAMADGYSPVAARGAGTLGVVEVASPSDAPSVKGLGAEFWRAVGASFADYRYRHPFGDYAQARAEYLAQGAATRPRVATGEARRSDMQEMMELYSGMTSVNEALQHDRGLLLATRDAEAPAVPVAEIERIPLAAHPWDRMIGELGKAPAVEPLAAYVPADMAYLHFSDLRTFAKLVGDLDDWVSPVVQWLEERGGSSHFMSRYMEQLVLERSGLAEKLGHVAAQGIAVVTSDPYLREGTDVSVIFHVGNRAALSTALAAFEANARVRRPDIKEEVVTAGPLSARRLFTSDLAVNQYRAEIGEALVLSNSLAALTHLAAAHAGRVPRLHEQGDFRYMRALYPWSKEEDGFLFLSDAFVARVVGPVVKILEARRMQAQADLAALNHASLLRGWVDGVVSKSATELVEAGYVAPSELQHPDGSPITLSADGGAASTWGSVARLTPVRDLEAQHQPLLATASEVEAYNRFRETYQSYWRSYIDPVGARITRLDGGRLLGIDARMLPLIDASEYDRIIREVGTQKIVLPERGGGLQWTIAIGKDARLRQELDGLARGLIPGNVGIGWLGSWVTVGVADRSGLWDMGLRTGMIPTWESSDEDMFGSLLAHIGTFPGFIAVHLASKVGLAGLLTGLKTMAAEAAPGMVSWEPIEPYRDIPIVRVGEGAKSNGQLGDLAVHYATVGDVFLVALDRVTLLGQIDRHLLGQLPAVPVGPPSEESARDTQTALQLDTTNDGWLTQTLLGIAEFAVLTGHSRVMDSYELLWRGRGSRSLSSADLRSLGIAYLGEEPRSPHGGAFSVVDGFPTHAVYGDPVRPSLPEVPVSGSPLSDAIRNLAGLLMSIEFEGEGDHRGLHTVVRFQSR